MTPARGWGARHRGGTPSSLVVIVHVSADLRGSQPATGLRVTPRRSNPAPGGEDCRSAAGHHRRVGRFGLDLPPSTRAPGGPSLVCTGYRFGLRAQRSGAQAGLTSVTTPALEDAEFLFAAPRTWYRWPAEAERPGKPDKAWISINKPRL